MLFVFSRPHNIIFVQVNLFTEQLDGCREPNLTRTPPIEFDWVRPSSFSERSIDYTGLLQCCLPFEDIKNSCQYQYVQTQKHSETIESLGVNLKLIFQKITFEVPVFDLKDKPSFKRCQ